MTVGMVAAATCMYHHRLFFFPFSYKTHMMPLHLLTYSSKPKVEKEPCISFALSHFQKQYDTQRIVPPCFFSLFSSLLGFHLADRSFAHNKYKVTRGYPISFFRFEGSFFFTSTFPSRKCFASYEPRSVAH